MVTKNRSRRSFGSLRRRSSGRWQASFVGPDGHRHNAPTTFNTKTEADAWLATQQAEIVKGEWTARHVTAKHDEQAARAERFGDYAARWIETRTNAKGEPL